jgi:hypothetical protein
MHGGKMRSAKGNGRFNCGGFTPRDKVVWPTRNEPPIGAFKPVRQIEK